ncbi:MAG: hypothetical protein Q9183_002176 [Haloplaca sp. 2 TL-2023]
MPYTAQADFVVREPKPSNISNENYRNKRREHYPGIGNGFPETKQLRPPYDCNAGWQEIKVHQEKHGDAKKTYYNNEWDSRKEVRAMNATEGHYYRTTAAGSTPSRHYELRDDARKYRDAAHAHGEAREKVYTAGPMIYPNTNSRKEHYDHIVEKYGESDEAGEWSEYHDYYAMDPNSEARDCYGRPVPQYAQPSNQPYPLYPAREGYYAETLEYRPLPQPKPVRKGGSSRR